MLGQRTSVGLDVHARSVVACGLDRETGAVVERRLTPDHREIVGWIEGLPGPVAVTYEAGPTGFFLARALEAAGVSCQVAAPSKLIRPVGDRVKTDARDAVHLARLLHLGQVTAVAIPTAEQEAARDLVRAREDCRGDLMTARHRISKLLLRQGIVYYEGKTWTGRHELWLRKQRFDNPALQLTYDAAFDAAMTACVDRRERLEAAIIAMAATAEFTPVVRRLGCLRGVATLTAFGLAVEIGDWNRLTGRAIGAYLGLSPRSTRRGPSGSKAGSPRPVTVMPAACSSKRPGITGRRIGPGAELRRRWDLASPAARARGQAANRRLHTRWVRFDERKKRSVVANVAIARELAGWCWRWPSSTTENPPPSR